MSPARVAEVLLEGRSGTPPDLGDTMVLVPTAGAGRAIRHALARQAKGGVLSPKFQLPMEAVLPEGEGLASPGECVVAWAEVLRSTPRARYAAAVPQAVKLDVADDLLGAAARLAGVCDELAEAGLDLSSPLLTEVCANDSQRWEELAKIYRLYLEVLARAGRRDPNKARLKQMADPQLPSTLRRIVVAGLPDLPPVLGKYLAAAEQKGVSVEVLAWTPFCEDARLDPWGRPDPEWWSAHPVSVPDHCLIVSNDSAEEAVQLLDFAASHREEGFALIAAAPECAVALEAEIARRGAVPYLPEGRILARTEPAAMVLEWDAFMRSGRLRDLRPLLHRPAFLRFLAGQKSGLNSSDALEACDLLLAERFCETMDDAKSWHEAGPEPVKNSQRRRHAVIGKFISSVASLRQRKLSGREWLLAVGDGEADQQTAGEWAAVADLLEEIELSTVLSAVPEDLRRAAWRREMKKRRVFQAASEDAVEIPGWLEAPWLEAPVVCVAGCREGALPAGLFEDAFLPDGVRARLGLASQASRYARDAYLLSCLLASRGEAELRLGVSRFRPGGEPNRPSRLLLGCTDEELPTRILRVFQPPATVRSMRSSSTPWKLRLTSPPKVEAIRVTGFKHYLECPLRFYLSQVLKLRPFDPEAREINPADFGTLVHRVLENYHLAGLSGTMEEEMIAGFFSEELDRLVAAAYGRHPAPVVRVQVESMRVRLRSLAALQAGECRRGWRILDAEYAVRSEQGHKIGSLALTGTMDRVEVHDELGLRILDYKTFATAKTPEETHFEAPRERVGLPEASIERLSAKGKLRPRSWSDLQLPLYRRLAAEIWPEHAAQRIEVGYILLPADPEGTQITFLALDDEAQQSAEKCASAIASRVARGVYWPPAPPGMVAYDDFANWFGGGDPAAVIAEDSIAMLEGQR
jgi:ATP-dependent helicase/nuclease subunit B